jgi:hypothetical protein
MGLNLGLDNRQTLPPFLPVLRNEDGLFAVSLHTMRGGFGGHLPALLFHRGFTPRPFPLEELEIRAGRFYSSEIFELLMSSVAPSPADELSVRNLERIGQRLVDWGSACRSDFEEMLRLLLAAKASQSASALQTLLAQHPDSPAFWRDDIACCLASLRRAVGDPDFIVPFDFREMGDRDEAARILQRLVLRFGELLRAWPALMSASGELRLRERGLCRPV